MTANQLAYQANLEAARANRAKEEENKRHNITDEYNNWLRAMGNPISALSHITGLSRDPGHDGSFSGIMENYTETLKDLADTIWGGSENRNNLIEQIKSIFGQNTTVPGTNSSSGSSSFLGSDLGNSQSSRGGIFR